jgi:hypothetical protein
MLVLKGSVEAKTPSGAMENFKIKLVLVNNFPFRAPKVYIDQSLHAEVVRSKNYIGAQNEVTIAYLTGWNISQQPNLKDLVSFIVSVIKSDPPCLSEQQRNSMYVQNEGNAGFNPQDNIQRPNQFFNPGMQQNRPAMMPGYQPQQQSYQPQTTTGAGKDEETENLRRKALD